MDKPVYTFKDLKDHCKIKYRAKQRKTEPLDPDLAEQLAEAARNRGILFHRLLVKALRAIRPSRLQGYIQQPDNEESSGRMQWAATLYANKIARMYEFYHASEVEYECVYRYDYGNFIGEARIDMVLHFMDGSAILYDFKTHEHMHYRLSRGEIKRRMHNYAYDLQAVYYKDIFVKSNDLYEDKDAGYQLIFCKTNSSSLEAGSCNIAVDPYDFDSLESNAKSGQERLDEALYVLMKRDGLLQDAA